MTTLKVNFTRKDGSRSQVHVDRKLLDVWMLTPEASHLRDGPEVAIVRKLAEDIIPEAEKRVSGDMTIRRAVEHELLEHIACSIQFDLVPG